MAINYIVVLDQVPSRNDFRDDYFPRGFHYAKEADGLVEEVKKKGGKAHVVPKSQFTPELLRQVNR
jgi:stalled ribosome rescue protein Dom34